MSDTMRAVVYGFLILAVALLPPLISLMDTLHG